MLEILFTENNDVYGKLNNVFSRYLPSPVKILRTENGKPYLEGNPLFFSISHSGDRAVIAICDKPVGIDLELIKDRQHLTVCSRFTKAEQAEINCEKDFLIHWTVREAYIKMLGATIAKKLNELEYCDNILYDGGKRVNCDITTQGNADCVYSICTAK